jgi:hypothetical protein
MKLDLIITSIGHLDFYWPSIESVQLSLSMINSIG